MAVELFRENQDFWRAEIDAKAAAFATVPINKDLTAELSCFGCAGNLGHLNLNGKAVFPEPLGANCPILSPDKTVEHSSVHFDRLTSKN